MKHLEHFHELKSLTRKQKFFLLSLLPVYFMAVSYTHLDVYKRQAMIRREIRKIPQAPCSAPTGPDSW